MKLTPMVVGGKTARKKDPGGVGWKLGPREEQPGGAGRGLWSWEHSVLLQEGQGCLAGWRPQNWVTAGRAQHA